MPNEEKRPSNHEITKRRVMSGIASYDIPKAIRQFALASDDAFLYVDFMTRQYRISQTSGMTEWLADGAWLEASFSEVLTIFDILFYSREDAALSGNYMLMQNLSRVQTSETYAGKGGFRKHEEYWDGKEAALAEGCERLGGVPAGKGDVAYCVPIFRWPASGHIDSSFSQIDMIMQFWSSDDEFPASFNFLFDENLLQFMHYETIWYVVSHFLSLLEK